MTSIWKPPFCLNPDCANRNPADSVWAADLGGFHTKRSGWVPRCRCRTCGRTLSRSTFDIEFRTKKHVDLRKIAEAVNAGEGYRSIGRTLGLRHETVANRVMRLGRQAIGILAAAREKISGNENLAADGLVSFTWSQYFPASFHVLLGSTSDYCHVVDYAVTGRSGTMTGGQKKRAKQLYDHCTMPKGSVDQSFRRIYGLALELADRATTERIFDTDEHKQYPRSMAKVAQAWAEAGRSVRLKHRCTSSRKARTRANPLAAVNYFDREIRKDCANHTRETLQWSKEANSAMLRMNLYVCWHNFLKPWRIKNRKETRCHGEMAGISKEFCKDAGTALFGLRIFLSRVDGILCESERLTWLNSWPNPHSGKTPRLWPCMRA